MFQLYALLVFLIIAWSLNTVFAKIGLQYMPPFWLTTSRLVVGTITAFILLGLSKRLVLPKRKDLPFIFSIGLLQMSLFQIFFNYGMVYVHAGRASILTYSTPLWVTPLAVFFFGEKMTLLKLLGFILGMAGIVVLFSPTSFDWSDPKILFGNGLLLLSALCWAAVMLHTRYGKWHSSPLELLPWQLLISCILPLFLALLTEPVSQIHWTNTLLFVIFFSGVIATALGYWISITISKALPVTTTSIALLSSPALTLIFSYFFIGEKLTVNNLTALFLIVGGLVCIALENKLTNSDAPKKITAVPAKKITET
jgi:drug/metabolite transporter (DMT)-like permease